MLRDRSLESGIILDACIPPAAILRRRLARIASARPRNTGTLLVRLDDGVETLNQSALVKRLREEADRSIADCLFSRTLVRESCDEYERHFIALNSQSGLQLDSAYGRHTDIGDHAPALV